MDALAALTLTVDLAAAVLFASLARSFARRPVSHGAQGARDAFVVFWLGIAVGMALFGLNAVLGYDGAVAETVAAMSLLTLCATAYGYVAYVLYFVTGRDLRLAVAVYYFLVVLPATLYVSATQGAALVAAGEVGGSLGLVLLLLVAPPVAATLWLLKHATATEGSRPRVVALSVGILAWTLGSTVASLVGGEAAEFVGGPVLSLVIAVAWLALLRPPRSSAAAAPAPA